MVEVEETSPRPRGKQKPPSSWTGSVRSHALTAVVAIGVGIGVGLFVPVLLELLSIGESRLVAIEEGPPKTPVLYPLKSEDGRPVLHIKISRRFKNYGFRRGHVDRVEVQRVGLTQYPETIEILRLDKTDLGWLEERDIECEFRVIIDPRNLGDRPYRPKTINFKAFFYGPSGNELYWEEIKIWGGGSFGQKK